MQQMLNADKTHETPLYVSYEKPLTLFSDVLRMRKQLSASDAANSGDGDGDGGEYI